MSNLSFKDYTTGLTTGTISQGADYIPYYDVWVGEMRKGTISVPSAWATFAPTLSWTSGSGATASVTSARVNYFWYLVFVEIHATVTAKGTCAGDFTILWPYAPPDARKCYLSWGVYASWGIVNRWLPYTESWLIKFISSAPTTNLDWAAISVGDLIFISWFYEI